MNVRINVQIKRFYLSEEDKIINNSVNKIMELFNIKPAEKSIDSVQNLPEDSVLVENIIKITTEVKVVTTLFFKNVENGVSSFSRENSAKLSSDNSAVISRLVKLNILNAMKSLTNYNPSSWGILRGIRPTKVVHRMMDAGLDCEETVNSLKTDYGIERSKAELITDIALRQRPFLLPSDQAKNTVSVYVGIPFCPTKCLYCSFPSYILPGPEKATWFLGALAKEIKAIQYIIKKLNLKVQTVYVGGGTPTSLNSSQFEEMLTYVKNALISSEVCEFTVEAGRPDSLDDDKIAVMRRLGVTRVSVNPQTMQEKTLKLIGRMHTARDIINLFEKIRQAGIPIINMDVIVGLPGENQSMIADTMRKISELQPDNLTIHTLAIKRGSLLKTNIMEHELPNEEVTQEMLSIATDFAFKMKMVPYYLYRQKYMSGNLENVGYSRPGAECLYNIQIMEERQTILGIGPAATTKIVNTNDWSLESFFNAKDLTTYVSKLDDCINTRFKLLERAFV
ncbi:coproporphyrinogen dehydrogenase HemZ [Dendrosporobacter sp. 1207_IL3150]|uniref:coproporphyrinogen dehydrogenase HemZ n=1 Tax=Dendrosporobacter sp. 1207_IL3150 TaxID=3084054 RepID=UPI002FD8E7DC